MTKLRLGFDRSGGFCDGEIKGEWGREILQSQKKLLQNDKLRYQIQ
jgi:hypothetical protein